MKVLVIEDDPLLVEMVESKLKREGFEVDSACNGEDGLTCAKNFLPDVVLSDISMPIMDGFEFLKTFKADESMKKTPVIMFSSLGDKEENLEKGKQLGASGFLIKSQLSLDDIPKKIKEVLGDE